MDNLVSGIAMLKANMEQNRLMNREMLNRFDNGLDNVKYQLNDEISSIVGKMQEIDDGMAKMRQSICSMAELEFPAPGVGFQFWEELFRMFCTNRRLEEQMLVAIAQSAFAGKISYPALNYALSKSNFILANPVPRLLLQCAMLGPFNPKNALNFVLIIRDKLREDWEESIQMELESLIQKVLTWKCRPEIMFPTAVMEYTKRHVSKVPPFDTFWKTFEEIIDILKSNQLIDAARIDDYDPTQELRNFDLEERAINNRFGQYSDDEPEYTNLNPVKMDPSYLELMKMEQKNMEELNAKMKRMNGHGRRHKKKEPSRKSRNRWNIWAKWQPAPLDSDEEEDHLLIPIEEVEEYRRREALRNQQQQQERPINEAEPSISSTWENDEYPHPQQY